MDDCTYVFRQTIAERKSASHGASHRKRGSKSKKCTLPSDHLTAAEKKKRNGDVMSYDLAKPMSFEDLKKMPPDLQTEYLHKLVAMGATRDDCAAMLGVSGSTLSTFTSRTHKGERFFYKNRGRQSGEEFLRFWKGETEKSEPQEEDGIFPTTGHLEYMGNASQIFQQALQFMDAGKKYSIQITFMRADG